MRTRIFTFLVLFFLIFPGLKWLNAQSFSDDIVSHWKLDEESGDIISDEITGANGHILGFDYQWIDGVNGTALDFSIASDTSIIIINDEYYLEETDFPTTSFSVACWVKINLAGTEQIIINKGSIGVGASHGPNSNGDRYMLTAKTFEGNDELRFTIDDGVIKPQLGFVPDTIYPEEWSHVVGVRDVEEKMMYLYLNGEMVASMEDTADSINTSGQLFLIGNYHSRNSKLRGSIDDVMVIKKALSFDEVYELFENDFDTYVTNSLKTDTEFKVTPNIVNKELVIKNAGNLKKIEIYSITGKIVKTISDIHSESITSDVNDLRIGKYIIKAFDKQNKVSIGEFIKK